MKSREQMLREWSRSLVATVLAVLIVAAIVAAAIQVMSNRDGGNHLAVPPKAGQGSMTGDRQAQHSTDRSQRLAAATGPNAATPRAPQVGETARALRNTRSLGKREPTRSSDTEEATTRSDQKPESSRLAVDAGSEPRPPDASTGRAIKPSPGNSARRPMARAGSPNSRRPIGSEPMRTGKK